MEFKRCLLQLYKRIQENETTARGAQISYFFLLSVFPFLLVLITLIEYTPLTQQHTLEQLHLLLPDIAVAAVEQIVQEADEVHSTTLLVLGTLGIIGAANRGVLILIKSINGAYNIEESRSLFKIIPTQIFAIFSMLLIIVFTLSFLVFGRVIGEFIFQHIGLLELFKVLWTVFSYAVPILVILSIFTLFFLCSPNCRLQLKNVLPGAIISTMGWLIASQVFAFFVNNFGNFSRIYGSIGGFIVFMIWIYISSIAVLLGGEINAIWYQKYNKQNS